MQRKVSGFKKYLEKEGNNAILASKQPDGKITLPTTQELLSYTKDGEFKKKTSQPQAGSRRSFNEALVFVNAIQPAIVSGTAHGSM